VVLGNKGNNQLKMPENLDFEASCLTGDRFSFGDSGKNPIFATRFTPLFT
jgi:hypothetical protein